ncbi:Sugar lactone lactonase YvrE [Planctomycetales bacterium 10988]|nr:Sugar lactone lactonase YvrE [Planctomycetales bacterium 10988]
MEKLTAECVLDAKALLAEGPCWDEPRQCLWWVDIENSIVNCFDPVTKENKSREVNSHVGFAIPTSQNDLILGTFNGFYRLDFETGGETPISNPEAGLDRNRFNDGKCDPLGRLWGGTLSYDRTPGDASLYCLESTEKPARRVIENVTTSNGLAWSADAKTMYYIDTGSRQVDALDFDLETGTVSNRRTIIKVPEEMGKPDGMTIDQEGMLWTALFRGGGVARWNPATGEQLAMIELPVTNVTSCCFAGEKYEDLYITSARAGLQESQVPEQPLAGGIFHCRPGVGGFPSVRFAG